MKMIHIEPTKLELLILPIFIYPIIEDGTDKIDSQDEVMFNSASVGQEIIFLPGQSKQKVIIFN